MAHATTQGRRRVAPWLIVTVVVSLLLAAGVVGYLLIVAETDDDAGGACTSSVVLPVAASPDSSAAIAAAAAAFDATLPEARSACVTTQVTTVPGDRAAAQLTTGWPAADGAAPAVWVVDSATDLAAVEQADSGLTAGRDADPLARIPVQLAVRPDAATTALTWADLPRTAGPTNPAGLPTPLILATPDPRTDRGTSFALQSVIGARAGLPPDQPVPVDAVAPAGADLAAVAAGGPVPAPPDAGAAMDELAAGAAAFSAVPVLATGLQAHNDAADPGFELLAVIPAGPAVGASVHAIALSASWIDPTMREAAAAFLSFLRGQVGADALRNAGMVVGGGHPVAPVSGGESSSAVPGGTAAGPPAAADIRPAAGRDVDDALAAALGR